MTQRTASSRLDLPQPLGPTTPVSPCSIGARGSLVRERGLSLLDDPEVRELGFGLFRVDHNISTVKGYPTPLDRDELRGAPIDPSGLVALLAEPLKTGARDFILRLLPDTANGMRRADRDREIETIDVQLRALLDERQEIIDNLHAAGTSTAG